MHYPGHKRDRFCEWVEDGFPAVAVVEVNYEERRIPAEEMLRQMLRCSDILPDFYVTEISDELGVEPYEWRRRTYGEAARRLLAARDELEERPF